MQVAKPISTRAEYIKECRRAVHALNTRFADILCTEDDSDETNKMSRVEQAWCNFMWELDEEIRKELKK